MIYRIWDSTDQRYLKQDEAFLRNDGMICFGDGSVLGDCYIEYGWEIKLDKDSLYRTVVYCDDIVVFKDNNNVKGLAIVYRNSQQGMSFDWIYNNTDILEFDDNTQPYIIEVIGNSHCYDRETMDNLTPSF